MMLLSKLHVTVLNCVFCPSVGGAAQSTCRGRRWAGEGALAPWTNWRILPALTTLEVAGLSLRTAATSRTTALPGAITETRMIGGAAAAPRLYRRREGTRGTAIAPLGHPTAKDMTTPSSAACWRARRGPAGGREGLPDRTRTVTRPLKAAPEERAAIVTTAGRLATAPKRRTRCLRTLSGRRSDTVGLSPRQTDTAPQTLPDQSGTGPPMQPWDLSLTPGTSRGCPTHCRGAERRETGTGTWWVTCSRDVDFLFPKQTVSKACK